MYSTDSPPPVEKEILKENVYNIFLSEKDICNWYPSIKGSSPIDFWQTPNENEALQETFWLACLEKGALQTLYWLTPCEKRAPPMVHWLTPWENGDMPMMNWLTPPVKEAVKMNFSKNQL